MDRAEPSLKHAVACTLVVWGELSVVQASMPGCVGVASSFAGASLLLWLRPPTPRPGSTPASPLAARPPGVARASCDPIRGFAGFALAGLVLQPWLGLFAIRIFELGADRAVALPPAPERCGWDWASALLLAPAFEERLYRARLLPALRARAGTPAAVVLSAACFALPHVDPLRVVGTFLAGLVLGLTRHATARVAPCVAMHCGFNVAALWSEAAMRPS